LNLFIFNLNYKKKLCIIASLVCCFICIAVNRADAKREADTVRLQAILDKDQSEQKFSYPTTLFFASTSEDIYVTDAGHSQLVVFNSNGYPVDSVGQGRGLHNIITALFIDKQLYVCCGSNNDFPSGSINVLNNAFFPVQQLVLSKKDKPPKKFIAKQLLVGLNGANYVLENNSTSDISIFDKNWNYLRSIVPRQERLGVTDPATIVAMAQDSAGNLYFLSEEMGRVFVYDYNEKFLFSFGEKGGDTGKLARPRGIAVDSINKRIYVSDYLRHTVLVYDIEGHWLYEIGSKGNAPSYFLYPSDVCCGAHGRVYVADTFNHRIQVFSITPAK
jgi:DNA-binding beta-propeller fold protein YncE